LMAVLLVLSLTQTGFTRTDGCDDSIGNTTRTICGHDGVI